MKYKILNWLAIQNLHWSFRLEQLLAKYDDRPELSRETLEVIYGAYVLCQSKIEYSLLKHYLSQIRSDYNYKCQFKMLNLIRCCDSYEVTQRSHHENLVAFRDHLAINERLSRNNTAEFFELKSADVSLAGSRGDKHTSRFDRSISQ